MDCKHWCNSYFTIVVLQFFHLFSLFPFADMKTQTESSVHSPFTKRQPYQSASATSSMLDVFLQDKGLPPSSAVSCSSLPQQTSAPHVVPPPASALPKMATVPSLGQQVSPSSSDAQSPLPLQQHKLKQQKKRTSITTKVTDILASKGWFGFSNINQFLKMIFLVKSHTAFTSQKHN